MQRRRFRCGLEKRVISILGVDLASQIKAERSERKLDSRFKEVLGIGERVTATEEHLLGLFG